MAYRQRLTDLGRDAIAKGQTGLLLTFTRIVLGEGESDFDDIPAMTDLVDPIMESPIYSVVRTDVGQVTITSKIPLRNIPDDFWLHEIGVYATVGSEPEVLYAVSVSDDFPDSITQEMPGGSLGEHTIKIAILIGTAPNVTAIFDPDLEVVNIGPPENGAGFFSSRLGNEFQFKRLAVAAPLSVIEDQNVVRLGFTQPIVPVGGMIPFAGSVGLIPPGWLLCNGAWYPKAQYPDLANTIGNLYGGDAAHFATPNCSDRVLLGASPTRGLGSVGGSETHTLTLAELASHGHGLFDPGHNHPIWIGEHSHHYADPGHGHGVRDLGHTHNVYHHATQSSASGHNEWNGLGYPGWGPGLWTSYCSTSGTGIAINGSGIGIAIANAIVPASVQHAWPTSQGLAVQANGGNAPHNNMQPWLGVNFIIRT